MLTKDKQLIWVKSMDDSDEMSHLFQQGSVWTQIADDQRRLRREGHERVP